MLPHAQAIRSIRSNPAVALRIARRPALDDNGEVVEAVKALTDAEGAALFAELPEEWRPFFRFLFETGVRVGEAIETRWRDVDLGARWLAVDRQFYRGRVQLPKGGKRRRVRIGEDLARELWRLRAETRAGDDELVFTAERGGRLIPSNLMRRVLKPAASRLASARGSDSTRCATRARRRSFDRAGTPSRCSASSATRTPASR